MNFNNAFQARPQIKPAATFLRRPLLGIDEIGLTPHANGEVFVEGNLLALEGHSLKHLNFLSSPSQSWFLKHLLGKQILVSEVAYSILHPLFPKNAFLPCRYMHPIEIGNLVFELLPSGESHGSSFLLIKKRDKSILFASLWNLHPNHSVRHAVMRKVDRLLINPTTPPSTASNTLLFKEKVENFAAKLATLNLNQEYATVFLNPPIDLAWILNAMPTNIPIYCDKNIFQYSKTLLATKENFDNSTLSKLASFLLLTDNTPKTGIILRGVSPKNLDDKNLFNKNTLFCSINPQTINMNNHHNFSFFDFRLAPSCTDVLQLIQETNAKDIFVMNNYGVAEQWVQFLRQHNKNAWVLSAPTNLKLF